MIPKRLHRIWFGDRPRPTSYDAAWASFQEMHPDWELITWTEGNLPPLINQNVYELQAHRGRSLVQMDRDRLTAVARADLVAYELMYRYGGVYVNCDIEFLKPIDDLLNQSGFAGFEDEQFVCNAVLGGVPGHPLYYNCIQRIPARFNDDDLMEHATGPRLLTEVYRSHDWDFKVYPVETFYPVSHWDVPLGGDASFGRQQALDNGSYAIHHWGHQFQEGNLDG